MRFSVITPSREKVREFITQHHRHAPYKPICCFVLGLLDSDDDRLVAVAQVCRPVNTYLDNGLTLEVSRLATDGTLNAASKLLSACAAEAWSRGMTRLLSYTLPSECGASMRASGFLPEVNKLNVEWNSEQGLATSPVSFPAKPWNRAKSTASGCAAHLSDRLRWSIWAPPIMSGLRNLSLHRPLYQLPVRARKTVEVMVDLLEQYALASAKSGAKQNPFSMASPQGAGVYLNKIEREQFPALYEVSCLYREFMESAA